MSQHAIKGWVSGRVQGVAYRASMQGTALGLGLDGWVKNLVDGRVAFHAEGDVKALSRLRTWAENGPALARVDSIHVEKTDPEAFDSFYIHY